MLTVDDDAAVLRLVERALRDEGYEIRTAGSGEEALDLAAARHPDLVILDVNMPGIDGFEVCARLRSDPATVATPVVFLTGLDDAENRVRGIEIGADEYLTKPFQARELQARVRTIIRLQGLRASLGESLDKVRRVNTFVENVAMGIDRSMLGYDALERLIVGHVLAGGQHAVPMARALAVGWQSDAPSGRVRCTVYAADRQSIAVSSGPVDLPDVIRALPGEVSIGLRYGPVDPAGAAAVAAAVGPALAAGIGPIRDAAVFAEGSKYLAAFNYPAAVTQFDAEILRGLSLYLSLSGRLCSAAVETESAFAYTVGALARAAEALDTNTGNHIVRVNSYAGILAVDLGLSTQFVEDISLQAQLHDVGKIHVDPAILRKPGSLTAGEWIEMKQHTVFGGRIIGDSPRLAIGRSVALSHHERCDGSGYPEGRKGGEIPLPGRIVAVADTYDAVRNKRPYKPAMGHECAVRAILEGDHKCAAGGFDPKVVEAFRRLERRFDELYEKMK
ncbi:MAG: response regulator [Deltaproteobacteria bacterium]|nr:response regulator [Deltaproteobacteria bacterium]